MPRLPPSLLHSLSGTHTLLPLLLRETRDVPSARNELRWITQHVDELLPLPPHSPRLKRRRSNLLRQLCVRRGVWGEPLQYILGKEYFGSTGVEIDVGKGVLVPRPETADLIEHFASLYLRRLREVNYELHIHHHQAPLQHKSLRILDLCTGTGCIPILLHSLLYSPHHHQPLALPPKILGIDISPRAISLARRNLQRNIELGIVDVSAYSPSVVRGRERTVGFMKGDIFQLELSGKGVDWIKDFFKHRAEEGKAGWDHAWEEESVVDVVVSNPPYIPPKEYWTTTARSVRRWEPKLALVPPLLTSPVHHTSPAKGPLDRMEVNRGDEFYPQIEYLSRAILKSKAVIVEVGGDAKQAERVRRIFADREGNGEGGEGGEEQGGGKGWWSGTAVWADWGRRRRGVVAWKGEGWEWLAEDMVR